MLQQTRVETVIPYFERFMQRFPDAASLAAADEQELLAHWSGLGYYRRARLLHQAAREMVEHHAGQPPADPAELEALPGIGRSTAGAIASLGHGRPAPILDGNVKRLFCRHFGIEGWPGTSAVLRSLWGHAEAELPGHHAADYNQGLMDLGATLCTPRSPDCARCPLADSCVARADGTTDRLPAPKPSRSSPLRSVRMLLLTDGDGRLLLERRPPSGIWGGLHSLPECASDRPVEEWCAERRLRPNGEPVSLPVVRHAFSHFRLDIEPVRLPVTADATWINEADRYDWYNGSDALQLGLPAPVRRLLEQHHPEEN